MSSQSRSQQVFLKCPLDNSNEHCRLTELTNTHSVHGYERFPRLGTVREDPNSRANGNPTVT